MIDATEKNTKAVGNVSEAYCTARFLELGWRVYLPFGDNERCDLLIERSPNVFEKVQVKTARLKNGYIESKVCSSYRHRGRKVKDYRGEVDWIALYCADIRKVFLVKPESAPSFSIQLRLESPANNQTKNIRWAKDYEI